MISINKKFISVDKLNCHCRIIGYGGFCFAFIQVCNWLWNYYLEEKSIEDDYNIDLQNLATCGTNISK